MILVGLAVACHAATEAPLPTAASVAFAPLDVAGTPPPIDAYTAEIAVLTNRAPALQIRNWYARMFAVSNPPPPAVNTATVAEALVLPEGIYPTMRDAGEIMLADPETCRALVARYRDGLAPTSMPVRLEHAGAIVGRVARLRYDRGVGVWATIEIDGAVDTTAWPALSPEMRTLSHVAEDGFGAWGRMVVPWTLSAVALTSDPAIPGTRLVPTSVRGK